MPRELILGTAGHIDHGKTSLVNVPPSLSAG
jgi:selenocysteine-specific translation elongation factor